MRIGIDLGGTKIEAIALDASGTTIARRRIASPAHAYGALLDAVCSLVREIERETARRGSVGVGSPGSRSPQSGLMRNANSTVLNGTAFQDDLSARLERPVRVANDANCFALSEAADGSAAGAACVFGVILGTGVGGGIVVDGALLAGANGVAGEWGHNALPWPRDDERPGPACYCGKRGCIETFLSGPALAADYAAHGGRACDARAVAAAARGGEAAARAALERHADRLARSLATVVNVLDPDVIVLGGGLSNLEGLYASLPVRMRATVFSDTLRTRIVPPAHGDASGVRGAAWLWPAT